MQAETLTYTTPGATVVTLPVGVGTVHFVAVGGRGGGVAGGFGAVVTGNLQVAPSTVPAAAPQIRVTVGGNGSIGLAGSNGGGPAGTGDPLLSTFAGGGGGASFVSPCSDYSRAPCNVFLREVTAAGGGGAGGDALPGTGGAGGAAGAAGSSGTSTVTLSAAGGGGAGSSSAVGAGGVGSVAGDLDCEGGEGGDAGGGARPQTGGAGGLSADLAGHGDGGGGGAGTRGGGGGGGGSWCADDTGTSGGGGGGGFSRAPLGGSIAVDTTGQPSVTLSYVVEQPGIAITTPRDGAVIAQGRQVTAAYACTPPANLPQDAIVACGGTHDTSGRIDTSALGEHTFTVTARDSYGLTAERTVHYTVTDQTRPIVRALRITPPRIDPNGERRSATVRFRLSERARVKARIQRIGPAAAGTARAARRVLDGKAGRNRFTLRTRIGGRTLGPGAYRLVLVATDKHGNRSRPARRRFVVLG